MSDDGTKQSMDDAAEAASRAADLERLLPGEDPETEHLEDARHWIAVYEELLGFKIDLLTVATEARHRADDAAVIAELRGTDLPILERERRRYEHRLAVWTDRYQELTGSQGRDPAPTPSG